MKETSIKWNDGRCENEEGIVKCVRKIHQEIYSREINFMPVVNFARLRQHITRSCLLEVQSLYEISFLKCMH
jgi:hypothetical protein